ncbi:DUF1330 domain-containing protein [Oricola cellulosilytica]|uniref:DUF1330 domain-containing protein n=1 Tax=Oricola cellulosilytica TaxID=1429082 RepID=A0A4R0PI67_9HYPH|nr:DUF1330 domain-containing protein [Oricola cellulosilytica]TCD16483.1 DUF1330 domain-containing protein [Oricola cellulosilytica]
MTRYVDPERARFGAFRRLPDDGPVHMLNLVRLRNRAAYADGRETTGAEAYQAYGRESARIFKRVGGRIVWSGDFALMLIGPEDEVWDHCFIAEYPSARAFVAMVKDPAYQDAVIHRQAAVEDSRLIRLSPRANGESFGS